MAFAQSLQMMVDLSLFMCVCVCVSMVVPAPWHRTRPMLCEALYGRGAIIVGPRHGTQLDLCLPAPRHNKQGAVHRCTKLVGPRNGRVWMRT